MEHLGLPVVPAKFSGGAGKKREAPVLVLAAIDPLGIKDRMAHQINRQAVGRVATFEHGKVVAHGVAAPNWLRAHLQPRPQLAVARQDDSHVVA